MVNTIQNNVKIRNFGLLLNKSSYDTVISCIVVYANIKIEQLYPLIPYQLV